MNKGAFIKFIESKIPHIVVSPEAMAAIGDRVDETEIAKNDYLLKAGKISGYFYLAEGFMRAYTFDADGNEITTNFFQKNRIIFEAASFFQHTPSTEIIQAVTPCRGHFTTFEKLNWLFHSYPEFREFGRAVLAEECVASKQRVLDMINKNAEDRYKDLMDSNPEIFQFAQLKHIASYLGMTDTSLSRIRKELSKK